ncbi:HlyD family efflux transporter periplasmic adaptor subunit [Rubinisphaera italica]|uniref:HlyD family secretion protein n=1 Tax=Rubinisphaera italica TaxID=2527969 RepID=A0A5C5XB94_9PLAN|nr:efflux RND transporter periplasmic adaptor subunit [Rubinisphaera italica]TWT59553.1 hypothetical protein Pan54_02600 [Rubinisphaera italica]
MQKSKSNIAEEISQLVPEATSWLLWQIDSENGFHLVASHGFGDQDATSIYQKWAGHHELLQRAAEQKTVLKAQGQASQIKSSEAVSLELIAVPLIENDVALGIFEMIVTNQISMEPFLQSDRIHQVTHEYGPGWLKNLLPATPDNNFQSLELLQQFWRIQQETPPAECLQALLELLVVHGYTNRCSLFQKVGQKTQLLAISGGSEIDSRSPALRNLTQFASTLFDNDFPEPRTFQAQDLKDYSLSAKSIHVFEVDPAGQFHHPSRLLLESFQTPRMTINPELIEEFPVWRLVLSAQKKQTSTKRSRSWWLWPAGLVIAAVLVLLPIPMTISAEGYLVPEDRRNLYAPETGTIHANDLHLPENRIVDKDQLLLTITSLDLETRLSALDGEVATLNEQIRSLRNTRPEAERRNDGRDTVDVNIGIRLAELKAELQGLQAEQSLVKHRIESLKLNSPLAGQILTWDAEHQLAGRPVQSGQHLLTVGDPHSSWEAIVEVRDVDLQFVKQTLEAAPQQEWKLVSLAEAKSRWSGVLKILSPTVEQHPTGQAFAVAAIDLQAPEADQLPGTRIRATLDCGKYPLGYVIFRAPIETLRSYLWW